MMRLLFNLANVLLLLNMGCGNPSATLPPSQFQSPPQTQIIRYGQLELFLIKSEAAPDNWLNLSASPQSQAAQACAKSLWNQQNWITVSTHSTEDLHSYLSNLTKEPFPSPKEAELCPL
ncbi:MAG: hypothetical protein ACON4U_11940 [Myxococcota bacterium]